MKATTTVTVDLSAMEEAIATEIESNLDTSGWGANGDSEYEIAEVSAVYDDGTFTITVDVERISGLFAPKDDLVDALSTAVSDTMIEVPLEES